MTRKKRDKKRKLLKIVFIPILIILFIQAVLPFITLVFSGVKGKLENNTISIDNHMVENCQVVLENDMNDKWRSVYKESDGLSARLSSILKENNMDISQFTKSRDVQQKYLESVFSDMVEALQYNTTSGLFLILTNDTPVYKDGDYSGFFIRDSDPENKTALNTDLMLERGNKNLSHNLSISLDSSWTTDFHFKANGKRSCDDFFYKPYTAALGHKKSDMTALGYWSKPFILQDYYMDNHEMITYSVPLLYENCVYGVLGVEISISDILNYFSVKELDSSLNAGYALVIDKGNGEYENLACKGSLCEVIARNDKFSLSDDKNSDLSKVNDIKMGRQDIYAITKKLNLYDNNVPYNDTNWVVCGFVTEDSVYGMGRDVYVKMIIAIVSIIIPAAIVILILVRYITKPVYRLMESVRGGEKGIHGFKASNIVEIDELHDVIENLTDAQKVSNDALMEEKERYRLAVKSSKDLFFTFRKSKRILEIVNSDGYDGEWDCNKYPDFISDVCVHPDDIDRVHNEFLSKDSIYIEFRVKFLNKNDYIWVSLSGSVMQDENGDNDRVVGCVHDITHRKQLEEVQKNKQIYDDNTSFYRLVYGTEMISKIRREHQNGVIAIIDIDRFSNINEQYGMVFGDIILEQLAIIIKNMFDEKSENIIYVRASADQMLLWIPDMTVTDIKHTVKRIDESFAGIIKDDFLVLAIKCGLAECDGKLSLYECINNAKIALYNAKYAKENIVSYDSLSNGQKNVSELKEFDEIDYFAQHKNLSMSSLALNLLDRGKEMRVVLDVLSIKLCEKYGMKNLYITSFNTEYLSNSMYYYWKENEVDKGRIQRCTGSQLQDFETDNMLQKLVLLSHSENDGVVCDFCKDKDGIMFHMSDNGRYAGSIILIGIDDKKIQNDDEKRIEEICSIIQNKFNLQKHDLSAKAKSDFLARMSHEIRTPMNGIIGMTEIALEEGQSTTRMTDCLKKIESSSNYLLGLLNDILDMAKIESGKMRLVYEKCNLSQCLDNIRNLMESKMQQKNITFTQNIDLVNKWFMCDELRLEQVLVNILSNAQKYSNENGNVSLTVKETYDGHDSSSLYFEIKDDGIGIEKDKQQLIFQHFEQADESRNARTQGTGLGLAICNRLVHMMNSQIDLDSELGKGSTFSFTINLNVINIEQDNEQPKKKNIDFAGKKVLVVEDNSLNMEIACELLENYKVIVTQACDGKEAVEIMKNCNPGDFDLILMDIMMPVMDGLEATRNIRQLPDDYCRKVPIVAMSANAFDEDVKRSLESGMDAHMSKPVNIKALEEILSQIWNEN